MGFGQLSQLSQMTRPKAAVITNIGTSHIGLLGSRENIFKAKMEITDFLKEEGCVILNSDDEYLSKVNGNYEISKYSISDANDIVLEEERTLYTYKYGNIDYKVIINEAGKHQIMNSLAGINVGLYFGLDMDTIIKGISKFKNFGKRMEKIELKNNITLIDDSYNASFDSMKSGLDVFNNMNYKRKIIVLGDMLELGSYSRELHENVGRYVNQKSFDIAIFCGDEAKYMYESNNFKNKMYFKTRKETADYINTIIQENDAIYFKASNGMKFIDIINEIKEHVNK